MSNHLPNTLELDKSECPYVPEGYGCGDHYKKYGDDTVRCHVCRHEIHSTNQKGSDMDIVKYAKAAVSNAYKEGWEAGRSLGYHQGFAEGREKSAREAENWHRLTGYCEDLARTIRAIRLPKEGKKE